jgi:hypothetical protein
MRLRYGDSYETYARRTGQFFPRFVERSCAFVGRLVPLPAAVRTPLWILCIVIGAGFLCRAVTLSSLPFQSKANLTLVTILPEDGRMTTSVLNGILLGAAEGKAGALKPDSDYLGYVMPVDYIMQGMIADTGQDSHLFMHHQTFGMITDWVLHPFEHLRRPPSVQMAQMHGVDPATARRKHCPLGIDRADLTCETCPYRRVILVQVTRPGGAHASGSGLLSFDAVRVPVEAIDINALTGEILNVTKVGGSTAWKGIPTPAI